jgi:DNA repair exonuclease SbcCD nuclease subunit
MAFAPVRFLHAADARLDEAIGEIPKLAPRLASILQDATRAAFDRFIALAIDHNVDFVLLAGNTFIEVDQSLAARLTLIDAFEQLDRSGIRAIILPGPLDPLDAWRRIPDLPENVTLLAPGPKGVVAVKRDEKVVARVGTELLMPVRKKARTLRDELRSESQRPVPVKIAVLATAGEEDDALLADWCPNVPSDSDDHGDEPRPAREKTSSSARADSRRALPVDYVALGSGASRRTLARRKGIAHNPGPLQGRGPEQAGPRGCTLVTVEEDGTLRCDFLAAASVRWERFVVEVPASSNRDDLLARCKTHLDGVRPEACENAWIFQWILRGNSPAIDLLEDEAFRRQLRQDLANAAAMPSADDVVHHLVIEADDAPTTAIAARDPLEADFFEALASTRSASADTFHSRLSELRELDPNWVGQLEGLLGELSTQSLAANAERIGKQLFRGASAQGGGR